MGNTFDEMINWCIQVSDAMSFLAKNNIIHVSKLYSNHVAFYFNPDVERGGQKGNK